MAPRLSPVDHAFRTEWAPLVAGLLKDTGSLELAEDVVSEAFVEAPARWRIDGRPLRPGAWLLTTARNKAIDRMRRGQRFRDRLPKLLSDSVGVATAADGTHVVAALGDDSWR